MIKGVKLYQVNAWQEYSDLDIVQMIGRAVRDTLLLVRGLPFTLSRLDRVVLSSVSMRFIVSLVYSKLGADKEGVAIIMCESELEGKYRNLVQGKTVLESSLHLNLAEHINSEIGIRSITSLSTAKEWIRSSFLRQRVQKNPGHYQIGKEVNQTWEEKLDELALQSIAKLKESQLITNDEEKGVDNLLPTDYGEIMSKVSERLLLRQFSNR